MPFRELLSALCAAFLLGQFSDACAGDVKPSTGRTTLWEKKFKVESATDGTGLLDRRTRAPIDPPRAFAKKDIPLPDGVLIFQSALPALGPRFLPKPGELAKVVFVEFPDDLMAPELITVKVNYRLVREPANEAGEYEIKLFAPTSPSHESRIRYNKADQIVSMEMFGKFKMVEVIDKQ